MAHIVDIQTAQKSLEDCVSRKMDELQAQLQSGGSSKDTVARVAEEFRTFRELIYNMLGLLRRQIQDCVNTLDVMETRQRRKALLFSGVSEAENENCAAIILNVLHQNLGLRDITASSIKTCHRLGSVTGDRYRPILVKFSSADTRAAVWRAKTKLKGTPTSVKEFLTRTRQAVFGRARLHFSMRACWTQDGTIVIRTSDGIRHKITSADELNGLIAKYPKVSITTVKTAPAPKV